MRIFVHSAGLEKMLSRSYKKNLLQVVFLLFATVFCASCIQWSIPDGDPPQGEIVDIKVSKTDLSYNEAVNYFGSSLIAFFLSSTNRIESIQVIGNEVFLSAVIGEMKMLLQFEETDYGNYVLKYVRDDQVITLQLWQRSSETIDLVWQDSIEIAKESI